MVAILMTSSKLADLGFPKTKVILNKSYDPIISVHGVLNKILSRDSTYTVDKIMLPKFGNSNISKREIIIALIL